MKKRTAEIANVSDLIPFPGNPRKMSSSVFEKLKKNIHEFGVVAPLTVDQNNRVVGGNQRLRAVKELGLKTVPILRIEGYSDREIKTMNVALNKIGGEFDMSELTEFLDFDFTNTFDLSGFEFSDLVSLAETENDTPNKVELVPVDMIHFLISAPKDKLFEIQKSIDSLSGIEGVEIETTGN
jgi:hypothetical protein